MKKIIVLIILIISLTGCAHFQKLLENDTGYLEEMVPAQRVEVKKDSYHDDEEEEISFHDSSVRLLDIDEIKGKEDGLNNPLDVVNEARKIALKEPSKYDIINGMAVYDYIPHTLYKRHYWK